MVQERNTDSQFIFSTAQWFNQWTKHTGGKKTALLFSCVPELFTEMARDCIVNDLNNYVGIIVQET